MTSCTTAPHEDRVGYQGPGLRRGRPRNYHARHSAELIQRLPPGAIVLPVQTLGELFNVLVRKARRRATRARAAVLSWRDAYAVMETPAAVMVSATDLASDHGLSIWDAVVLAAAAEAECRLLLSDDLQAGFTWRGITVANPFAPTLHPILAALLADA